MKYFIIAGEQSGDLHGSNLVRELLINDKDAEISCWGGDLMETAGAKLLMHYKKTAIMGLTAILKNLGTIARNFSLCRKQIADYRPDVVILIDFAAFNMRIAKYAKRSGFKVFYYISPKFWAWGENRVRKVKKYIDRMFIIFPFEADFYKKYNISVQYQGNPLVDETERRKRTLPDVQDIRRMFQLEEKPVIGLLAGSRRHEVVSILPQMVKVVRDFPECQFVIAGVRNLPDELYLKIIGNEPVKLVKEETYEILKVADAALVASGTANLETALFDIPQVVCYKGDFFSMLLAWTMIRVKYISLVNLIMNAGVVKELLGYSVNKRNLSAELKSILTGGDKREKLLADYKILKEKLGPAGASGRIARDMVEELRGRKSDGESGR